MPIYEYQAVGKSCSHCESKFEVLEKIKDKPLKKCPECGEEIERVFSAFAVTGKEKELLSPKNLAAKGFTQYKKAGSDGTYEKTAGKGPDLIHRGT